MTNVSGIAAEKFFNPQFQKIMEELRKNDDQVRSIVTGTTIGSGDPGMDPKSLKDLLKMAKSNFNRREYMTATAELARFHRKITEVIKVLNAISDNVDEVHHEFLFKDLGPEHKEELLDLQKRWETKKAARDALLVKEAGVSDIVDFLKTFNTRGRGLAAWEKRYPQEVGKIKSGVSSILQRSESLFDTLISSLKEMARARSTRDLNTYIKEIGRVKKSFEIYENGKGGFKDVYNGTLKNWVDKMARLEQTTSAPPPETTAPTAPAPGATNLGKTEIAVEPAPAPTPSAPAPTVPAPTVMTGPAGNLPPGAGPPFAPAPHAVEEEEAPVTLRDPSVQSPPIEGKRPEKAPEELLKTQHRKFFASLESLSNESPLLLASYINKYARSVQISDPDTAIQLFKIAKSIRG